MKIVEMLGVLALVAGSMQSCKGPEGSAQLTDDEMPIGGGKKFQWSEYPSENDQPPPPKKNNNKKGPKLRKE